MSLFDSASLIVTPSGYKEDKLYSIKPTDGSGDLVVTRATTATRVNSDGLIEQVPYNLLQRSEQFDNATWVKERITITANATTAPNGTLTADKIVEDTTTNSHRARQNTTSEQGVQYTLSYYLKASERTKARITVGGLNAFADFDLSNGTIIGTPTLCTASIIEDNNGWYRCSITYTQTSATSTTQLHLAATLNAAGDFSYLGDGVSGIFVWGAQLVTGTSAKEYFPTTDRLDVPRLDYTNSSCPSILVEPQRTNLALYSEQFDNAVWAKTRATVVSNATIAPDGNLTADKLIPSVDNNTHILQQSNISVTAQIYSATVYAKKGEYDTVRLLLANLWSPNPNAIFNLTTKSIVSTQNVTAKITELTNGWFKLEITSTINAVAGSNGQLLIYGGNNGLVNFAGDGTSGVFIWGAQLEAGSNATSYIPTVASSVTRNADVISKTGISNLINSEEGVLFADIQFFTGLGNIRSINISNGDNNNRIGFYGHPSVANRITFAISSGGNTTDINYNGVTLTNRNKVIIRYSGTTFTAFVNGVKSTNQTFTPFAANFLNRIGLDYGEDILRYEGIVNSIQLYKTALTDQQCIDLTTI